MTDQELIARDNYTREKVQEINLALSEIPFIGTTPSRTLARIIHVLALINVGQGPELIKPWAMAREASPYRSPVWMLANASLQLAGLRVRNPEVDLAQSIEALEGTQAWLERKEISSELH